MTTERETFEKIPQLPANVHEQIEIIKKLNNVLMDSVTNLSYPEWLLQALNYRIGVILLQRGIKPFFKSLPRVKTLESIEEKIANRPSNFILGDWLGIRHVFETWEERVGAAKLVQEAYPLTPKYFPDGKPTYRDYADENLKKLIRENFNSKIYRVGSALHVNFFVVPKGLDKIIPCEYQSMTIEEYKIYKKTHGEYKNGIRLG